MKIYLVRHAESTYNVKKLLQGKQDCELSQKGLKDTIKKASTFPNGFDVVFCSPLKRTKKQLKYWCLIQKSFTMKGL